MWKTTDFPDKRGHGEYDIVNNVELDELTIRVTRETLREDRVGLSCKLSPAEAMQLGALLLETGVARLEEECR